MGEMTNAQGTSAQTSSWECKTAIDPEALINYFGENFNQIFFSPRFDFSVMRQFSAEHWFHDSMSTSK